MTDTCELITEINFKGLGERIWGAEKQVPVA